MSVGLYGTFLAIQTDRHRNYFTQGDAAEVKHDSPRRSQRSLAAHAGLLAAYMLPVVYLAEQLARPIDHLVEVVRAPAALGGVIIAMLVGTPEAIDEHHRVERVARMLLARIAVLHRERLGDVLIGDHLAGRIQHLNFVE
jgi:Ca2+:H+ antiporter